MVQSVEQYELLAAGSGSASYGPAPVTPARLIILRQQRTRIRKTILKGKFCDRVACRVVELNCKDGFRTAPRRPKAWPI